jgi:3-dehydrosphinganine reductase
MKLTAGKHIVITGGSSGLGLELAHQLAARGARLTLLARDPVKLRSAAQAITARAPGASVGVLVADVSESEALQDAFATLAEDTGRIDVLINSAGIAREGYFETLSDTDFRAVMDINFFGTLHAIRAALPHLKASQGAIVNIASVAGLTGVFGYTPYCAAKHALVGLTESLRFELEPQGVQVHLVCPSEFDSPMVNALDQTRTRENRKHVLTIPKMSVEQIAAQTLQGVDAGRRTIIPGTTTRILVTGQRLAPTVASAIARRRIKSVYRGPTHDAP